MRYSLGWFGLGAALTLMALPVQAQQLGVSDPRERIFSAANMRRVVIEASRGTQAAQGAFDDADWQRAGWLRDGSEVRVTQRDGNVFRGLFRLADDRSITLTVSGHDETLLREGVWQVSVGYGSTRGRHARSGLLAGGLGVGLPVAAITCHCGGSWAEGAAPAFWFFGGIGALIGAALPAGPKWEEVYRRR